MLSVKTLRICGIGLGGFVLAVCIPAAHASTIEINSNTTSLGEYNVVPALGFIGSDVAVVASPVWAPAGIGYEWVSYANTGCNTFVVLTGVCTAGTSNPPAVAGNITLTGGDNVPTAPTAVFFNQFTLPDGNSYSGTLSVWADDTARVYLNGNLLVDANSVLGTNCAAGPVGCLTGMNYSADLAKLGFLRAGINTLQIDAYQLNGASPFGVMYTAAISAEPASTPEPASYALLGLGLAVIGILMPRSRRT